MKAELLYRLAPGLEIVYLEAGRYHLRSDFVALALSGENAEVLVDLLGVLSAPVNFSGILACFPDHQPESLRQHLDAFVNEGVVVTDSGDDQELNRPFAALLNEIGLGADAALAALAEAKIAIFGLEAHGAHVAQMLADAGVGRFVLVDPFPFEVAHCALTPVRNLGAVKGSRENALAQLVAASGAKVTVSGDTNLTRERVQQLAQGCRLLIVCWDHGFHAAHHWANQAAHELGVPALFSQLRATRSFAGPLYLPGRSACWMCYRMRTLAAEADFDAAMAYEEHLNHARLPKLAARALLPILPQQLASTLALEALKLLLRLNQPTLVDKVLAFDALLGESRIHPVLVKPFCPVCSKKKGRDSPAAAALVNEQSASGPILPAQAEQLVSEHCGIVIHLSALARDATEPPLPHVWRARLANHCFLSEVKDTHLACSGKGVTKEAAWASCLGEAVERYSGGCWDAQELVLARRSELNGRSIDPADLGLYRPEQYAALPYTPYREDSVLRWVRGRSLVHDDEVWLPALAVFMEYQAHGPDDYLFPITSNGLAAGSTLTNAVVSALYELLERDSVLLGWLHRLPGLRHDALTHPDADVRRLAQAYRRRGVELALYRMPTDHPVAVFLGAAFQRGGYGGPYATVGMGADLDVARAARSAALEVGQVRPAFRERCRTHDSARIAELVGNPSRVKSLEDHALLYADPAMAAAFDFLNGDSAEWPRSERTPSPGAALGLLLQHFRAVGQEAIYVNLTPRDLEPLHLFTARAILPGYQPIWFGYNEARLGGPRALDWPARVRVWPRPIYADALNPMPHPIA
jgi:ribosomal protein S12 methylthiotransferase accessory factor